MLKDAVLLVTLLFKLLNGQFQRQIKVGLLFSDNEPYSNILGYDKTVGILNLAMNRINNERLIPQFNFTFITKYDQCSESLAAGSAAELLEISNVDVLIGPVCSDSAIIVGAFATFYNVPMITWGYAAALELANASRYPTSLSTVGPSKTVANALVKLLMQFQWTQFAYLYDVTVTKTCTYIRDDLLQVISSPLVNVDMNYYKEFNFNDSESVNKTIGTLSDNARVVVLCVDDDESKRQVLLLLQEKGYMNNDSYVFIMVRYRGTNFNRATASIGVNSEMVPLWQSVGTTNSSAKDDQVKKAMTRMFILDLDRSTISTDDRNLAIASATGWPFYCTNCTTLGIGAPGLADSLYMYALGLNLTLRRATQPNSVIDYNNLNLRFGADIRQSLANVSFLGLQGNLSLDNTSVLINYFNLVGLSSNFSTVTYYKLMGSVYDADIFPTSDTPQTWFRYNGEVPLAVPVCGFDDSLCPPSALETYGGLIWSVVGVTVAAAIATGAYLLRGRYLEYQRLNAAWQVNFHNLISPKDTGDKETGRSQYSLPSSVPSLLRKEETKNFSFYIHNGESVAARRFVSRIQFSATDRAQLRMMRQIDHDNLAKFFGICTDGPQFMSIWRFYHRGSITDIIATGSFAIDGVFMISLIRDIVNGLHYIHRGDLHYHGHFNSSNCLVDERWVCKIADYGITSMHSLEPLSPDKLLYMAPELLKRTGHPLKDPPNKSADIYSLSIVAAEIVNRKFAWEQNTAGVSDHDEILYLLKRDRDTPMRPILDTSSISDLNAEVPLLIKNCWEENPDKRPTTNQIRQLLRNIGGSRGESLMDHVFQVLERYMNTLQEEVESRTKALVEEKKRSDVLLYRLLPRPIADKLKTGSVIEPESFDSVTVFFSDVVRFGELASKSTPVQAITLLNDLFTMFDGVIETYDCYKVESVGDDTLVASGLPTRNGIAHVKEVAKLSLAFMNGVAIFQIPHLPHEKVQLRIGFHSGSCVAGVVGLAMPRYCLFGDTINTASRMCSNSRPDRIHLSSDSNALLQLTGGFVTRSRGELIIKGKGVMETYFLEGLETAPVKDVSPSRAPTAPQT